MANGVKQAQPARRLKQKSRVKRVLMGMLWVYLIWLATRLVCAMVIGLILLRHNAGAGQAGQEDARVASLTFMNRYGLLVFVGSFVLATLGTMKGILPGTKGIDKAKSVTEASSEGVWPPPPNPPPA